MSGPDLSGYCKCPYCDEMQEITPTDIVVEYQECEFCKDTFDPRLCALTWVDFYQECNTLKD